MDESQQQPLKQQDPVQMSSNSPVSMDSQAGGDKKFVIAGIAVLIIIVVAAGIYFLFFNGNGKVAPDKPVVKSDQPKSSGGASGLTDVSANDDKASTINTELDNLNVGDLDGEFKAIDSDINQL